MSAGTVVAVGWVLAGLGGLMIIAGALIGLCRPMSDEPDDTSGTDVAGLLLLFGALLVMFGLVLSEGEPTGA